MFLLSCNVQYIASVSTAALVHGRDKRLFLSVVLRPVMGPPSTLLFHWKECFTCR